MASILWASKFSYVSSGFFDIDLVTSMTFKARNP